MILDKIVNKNQSPLYSETQRFTWKSMLGNTLTNEDYLKESTYLKCISYTANKIASLTFHIKRYEENIGYVDAIEHPYHDYIALRPNSGMNFTNMIRSLVTIGEHEGISCLYIAQNGMLFPCRVNQIFIDNAGLIESMKSIPIALEIVCNNQTKIVAEESCIIYHGGLTTDGVSCVPIMEYLKQTMKTTMEGQNILSKLFESGLTNKALIQLTSDIKDEKDLKKIQAKFNRLFSNEGRIFTVPAGYNVSPLNLSLADSQFKELRGLSRREIASNFGLSPSMIGEETSGTVVDINFNVLLRTTAEKQKSIITDYVKHGIYSIEYAKKLLGVPNIEDETVTLPSGQVLLRDLLAGKLSYQDKETKENKENKERKGGETDGEGDE
ncbi:MAG: phage portal protein [Clostridium sp.]|nr:phage portal protein [Clostridium sp.]